MANEKQPAGPVLPAKPAKAKGAPIKVRAKEKGYYYDTYRNPGDEFDIASSDDFSESWMEYAAEEKK